MINKKYGKVFKQVREQYGLPISKFNSVGLSKSTISNFEQGKTMMGFQNLDICLNLMGTSLEEYDYLLNFYSENMSLSLFKDIELAILTNDLIKLKQLLDLSNLEANQRQAYLLIKVQLEIITLEEEDELIEFLYNTTVWGIRELYVFYLMIDQMKIRDIQNIYKVFTDYISKIRPSYTYIRIISLIYFRLITTYTLCGLEKEAKYYINIVNNKNLAETMFLKNLFNGTRGYWIYRFVDHNKGSEMMSQSLKIQELLGQENFTIFYKRRQIQLMKALSKY